MSDEYAHVPIQLITDFAVDALAKMGVPREDAAICADVLIASDIWGIQSHGLARLKTYHGRIKKGLQLPETNPITVKETPTTAVIDGAHGMGMVVGYRAMQMAIDKAKNYGMGSVAVRNSSHYGVAGYYAKMAVKQNMVGFSCTNARPSIAPTFGVQPMLGTNPIAVGVPTDEAFPFLFDAATSIAPRGKLEVASRANKPLPEGWVVSQDGTSAIDATQAIADMDRGGAALLPLGGMGEMFAGHKGYGFATIVELFSAAFQNGSYLLDLSETAAQDQAKFLNIGHFFMAINVENFLPLEDFKKVSGNILRDLRNSNRAPGQERIYTAGEKEYYATQRAESEGIKIAPGVQKALLWLRDELELTQYDLGF